MLCSSFVRGISYMLKVCMSQARPFGFRHFGALLKRSLCLFLLIRDLTLKHAKGGVERGHPIFDALSLTGGFVAHPCRLRHSHPGTDVETATMYGHFTLVRDVLHAASNEMILEHVVPDWPFECWLAWIRQELLSHDSRGSGCSWWIYFHSFLHCVCA